MVHGNAHPNQSSESAHSDRMDNRKRNCSIDHFLQLLHCQCTDGLGSGLGLEDAWLLGEGVHTLAGRGGWFLLQLQVQAAANFESAILLQLASTNLHQSVNNCFHLFCLQTVLLCNGRIHCRCRHCSTRFHGLCLHCLHCRGHCC